MLALEIENLGKDYEDFSALKELNLQVEASSFFSLLGENGAGKTTLINIVSGLIAPSRGKVRVFGYDIGTDGQKAKAMMGVVPQEFNFNIFERVIDIVIQQAGYYGLRKKQAMPYAEHLLKKLHLWERRHQLSRNLSGGMKRRLMIARSLIHRPRLLFLDEPTAGVDPILRRETWDFLKELNETEGCTMILTTHYLEEAEALCRDFALLNRGKIIAKGAMHDFFSRFPQSALTLEFKEPCKHLPEVPGYSVRFLSEQRIELALRGAKGFAPFFAALLTCDLELSSVQSSENRLERLLRNLLGRES